MSRRSEDILPSERLATMRRQRIDAALTEMFGPLDASLMEEVRSGAGWVKLAAGEVLFHEGDPGDSLYIVVSGRLQAVVDDGAGGFRVLGDVVRGQTLGELALFMGAPRTAGIRAVRESVLVRLSQEVFETLVSRRPQAVLAITRLVAERLANLSSRTAPRTIGSNIAILPVGPGIPVGPLIERLIPEMERVAGVSWLSSRHVEERFGPDIKWADDGDPDHYRLLAWLDECELQSAAVIYQGDSAFTPWTRLCIRQADTILIAATSDMDPPPAHVKGYLDHQGDVKAAHPELVIIHPRDAVRPIGTARWFEGRRPIPHHHIRWDRAEDIARLARFLTGTAVGLVLGGGGARGLAHLGVVRALRERGVPIDAVGGTSIGSVVAASVSMGWDIDTIERRLKESFTRRNPLGDFNIIPYTSVVKGRRLEKLLREQCDGAHIEDLWYRFFCVSSNLNDATMHVHRHGLLWKALRASGSLPGVLPPVVFGDRLLIDGAVFNNMPVDVMRESGVGRVIAVDLGVRREYDLESGEVPSLWHFLKHRLRPRARRLNAPHLMSVLTKSTTLSSRQKTERMKEEADLYLNPVIDVGLTDWKAFDDAVEQGYRHTRDELEKCDLGQLFGVES